MMRPAGCEAEILRALASMPFIDRLDLAAVSGWSRGAVYEAVERLDRGGYCDAVTHATGLFPAAERFHLTAAGLERLAAEEEVSIDDLVRLRPVSDRWRRILMERLDALAAVYRLAAVLSSIAYPIRFRWYRAAPLDAAVEFPDGSTVGVVRRGHTADRSPFANRMWKLRGRPLPGTVLVLMPDPVRLRHARRMLDGFPPRCSSPSRARRWRRRRTIRYGAPRRSTTPSACATPWTAWLPAASFPKSRSQSGPRSPPTWPSRGRGGPSTPSCCPPPSGRPRSAPSTWCPTGPGSPSRTWPECWAPPPAGLPGGHPPGSPQAGGPAPGVRRAPGPHRPGAGAAGPPGPHVAEHGEGPVERRSPVPRRPFEWTNVAGGRSRQLLRNLEHTAAVHAFLASMTTQAAFLEWEVVQLDPPRRASRFFRHGDRMRSVNPDAFGLLRRDGTHWPFFLEWERRAVRPSTMSQRLAPYLRYYSSHRPTDDHGARPDVLIVFDDDIAQTHFLRLARQEMQVNGVAVPLWVSHRAAVVELGPLGRAWRTPADPESPQALLPQ